MAVTKIRSPKTGKLIKVNGTTYKNLEKDGYSLSKTPRVRITKMVKVSPKLRDASKSKSSFKTANTRKPTKRTSKRAKKNEPRNSPTRGWATLSPQKGRDRHLLKRKCGDKCFLVPETEAFPICSKCSTKSGKVSCTCKTDCRAIIAAKVRASEWKYENVKKAAEKISRNLKC